MLIKRKLFFTITLFLAVFCLLISIKNVNAENKILNKQDATEYTQFIQENLPRSYNGYCGKYVRDILALHGILDKNSFAYNGKDWFFNYQYPLLYNMENNMNIINDGWSYMCYSGKQSIDEIIENYGYPVHNIAVSIGSDSIYGHVFFIYTITEDYVYYTECFNNKYGREKEVIQVTRKEFADSYINHYIYDWSYGGAIHFYETNKFDLSNAKTKHGNELDDVFKTINNNLISMPLMRNVLPHGITGQIKDMKRFLIVNEKVDHSQPNVEKLCELLQKVYEEKTKRK